MKAVIFCDERYPDYSLFIDGTMMTYGIQREIDPELYAEYVDVMKKYHDLQEKLESIYQKLT